MCDHCFFQNNVVYVLGCHDTYIIVKTSKIQSDYIYTQCI